MQKKISYIQKLFIRILVLFIPSKSTRNSIRLALLELGFKETLNRISKIKKDNTLKNFKYYLSIVATIKDEAQYINEWIEFYKLQGIDHFYIYDNDSSDNLEEVLTPYIKENYVTYIKYPGKNMQYKIYNDALEKFKTESKWLAPLDIDEFVYAPNHETIKTYLKENEKYNQICIKWLTYGSSGLEKQPEGLVIENFKMREKASCQTMKSIIQATNAILMFVHKHSVLGLTKNSPVEEIRCNHYYTKSKEEFINKKMVRGSSVDNITYTITSFEKHDKNEISDPMPIEIVDKIKENLNNKQDKK